MRMDCQRHRIDGADGIDGANVIDMPMCVDDIFGNELILLDMLYDAFRLVARVDDDGFERLRTGVQVTILLKHADCDTYNFQHVLLVRFGHATFFLPLTLSVSLISIIQQSL